MSQDYYVFDPRSITIQSPPAASRLDYYWVRECKRMRHSCKGTIQMHYVISVNWRFLSFLRYFDAKNNNIRLTYSPFFQAARVPS